MAHPTPQRPPTGFLDFVAAGNRASRGPERDIERIAARHFGLFTRAQALKAGLSSSGIQRRLDTQRWIRIHRNVYLVAGCPRSAKTRLAAATLAVGGGAVASHRSAGWLWGLCAEGESPEVSVLRSIKTCPKGVVIHHVSQLAAVDRGRLSGIPITSPARTLIDLAALLQIEALETAVHQAVLTRLVTLARLRERLAASSAKGRRGPAVLRRVLEDARGDRAVRSPLERRLERLLHDAGFCSWASEFPVQVDGRTFYLDFAFPEHFVAVEADGRKWHSTKESFEHDRQRHNLLAAEGWRVLRVTDEGLRKRSRQTVELLHALLSETQPS